MKSKKNTSPVRSRDKVLQSLYEIELGGSTAKEILKDKDIQEFFEDVKRLHYIRRLFKRYKDDNILKERLIINHLVTFYNVFENKAATRILFHRIEKNFHSMLKTFLVYLNRMPTDQHADIPLDNEIITKLRGLN